MFYIVGSTGIVSKILQKIINKKNYILISSKKKDSSIYSKIFNNKKINEKWINNIKKNDTIIFLSNLGNISFYNKKKKIVRNFHSNITHNFFNKLNLKTKIIFFSSDMVFFGKKNYIYSDNSKQLPKNNYGKSKSIIEKIIRNKFKNHLILRLSKIYSLNRNDKSFINNIISQKKNFLFFDQIVHYLNIRDLKNILKIIINRNDLKGSYNVPGKICCSRFYLLNKLIKKINKNNIELIKISIKSKKFIPINLKLKTLLYKKINYKPKYIF